MSHVNQHWFDLLGQIVLANDAGMFQYCQNFLNYQLVTTSSPILTNRLKYWKFI